MAIFAYLVIRGAGSLIGLSDEDSQAGGRDGGGMANAHRGLGHDSRHCDMIGIPFGIGCRGSTWPNTDATGWETGPIYRRCSERRALDRHWPGGLRDWWSSGRDISLLSPAGVALAIMMVPMVARTTEAMLLLVPQSVREAAFGLGIPQWRTTISIIVVRRARAGILTGIMLAFARIAGETAPLMFTALGNQFWSLESKPADRSRAAADLHLCALPL